MLIDDDESRNKHHNFLPFSPRLLSTTPPPTNTSFLLKCKSSIHPEHLRSLLLRYTDGSAVTSRSFCVLSTDFQSPIMTKTFVQTHFFHPFKIITPGSVQMIGCNVLVMTFFDILLAIEEPCRNLELGGVPHN